MSHHSQESVSIEQLWKNIEPFSRSISVGTHSYLPDGRQLITGFATGLPTGSFKERGALGKMMQLRDEGYTEAVAFSAGNHAAGAALGARVTDMFVKIYVPDYTPPEKVQNTEYHGGDNVDVERVTGNIEAARAAATAYANETGAQLLDPSDIMVGYGQGTVGHELLVKQPGIDHLFVPAGYGGLALGCIEAIKQVGLHTKVYGVKLSSEGQLCEGAYVEDLSPAAYEVIQNNPDLWGGLLYVDPYDVGKMVALEEDVRTEHAAAMGDAAFDEMPEATGLLGAAAAHRFAQNLGGTVATIITGANRNQANLDTLHRYYRDSAAPVTHQPLQVASGFQLRRTAA